jgi:thiol peroxidase
MGERKGLITFKGSPLTLVGTELRVGDDAPDFLAVANDMSEVRFSSLRAGGGVFVLSSVPSLDTSVCSTETHTFNKKASDFGPEVTLLTVSMDLPFAQARWCGAMGVDRVKTLSDYRYTSFGAGWGVLIKEWRLLARCIFVVDRKGKIRYIQLVKEIATEPDYAAVLDAVKKLRAE